MAKIFYELLTLTFVLYSFCSNGQDSLQTNIDTVKYVTAYIERQEGVNGKLQGSVSRPVLNEAFKIRAGYNKIYRENGKLYFEGTYKLTRDSTFVKYGYFKYYDANGQLEYVHDFTTQVRAYYFPNGIKKSEGQTTDSGEKTGIWKCFYSTGTIKSVGELKDRLKHGVWRYYDKHGKLKNEIVYTQWTGTGKDCCDWE